MHINQKSRALAVDPPSGRRRLDGHPDRLVAGQMQDFGKLHCKKRPQAMERAIHADAGAMPSKNHTRL
jgi:hypothetical protein